jgi:hypothetical protein
LGKAIFKDTTLHMLRYSEP